MRWPKIRGILATSKNTVITWKHVLAFILISRLLKCIFVLAYCSLCHMTFYRWTSCKNDAFYPKEFEQVNVIESISTKPCVGTEKVLIYVPSLYSDFHRRQLIRDTWAKSILNSRYLRAKFVFVLGSPSREPEHEYALMQESDKYDDILKFNIIDHYFNLTLKTRAIFNWTLRNCARVQFLIRADTDIVLHARNLNRFLRNEAISRNPRPLVIGQCRPYDCVTRIPWSKSCIPKIFHANAGYPLFYPGYCLGFSSVVNMEYIRKSVRIWTDRDYRLIRTYLPMEDLYTFGYTGEKIHASKLGHPRLFVYHVYFDKYSCKQSSILASSAYEDENFMRIRWENYEKACDSRT